MGEDLFTDLSIDNHHHHHPSTFLSMDSGGAVSRDELETRPTVLSRPPDINISLSSDQNGSSLQSWNLDSYDVLDVGLAPQGTDHDAHAILPKTGTRKCIKRLDSLWGAWFFFCYYFRPVLNDKSKCKVARDGNGGVSGFDKNDLDLDVFLVQHDMENMYMWVFRKRPDNALGKMQLRSFMNGHSRQGEPPFPFSADKGFVRSHRMQRKHYRGLSNPQCVHGIELVSSPNFEGVDEEEQKRWVELTGRDLNFTLPPEASEFSSWRNLPATDIELERPLPPLKTTTSNSNPKKLINGSGLNLLSRPAHQANGATPDLSPVGNNKRKKDMYEDDCYLVMNQPNGRLHEPEVQPPELPWVHDFSGVMENVYGPVTAAKTIYEDDQGYLIIVSLPFCDLKRVKVTWWNNPTHGVIKISSVSTACMPYIKRNGRTFELTDPSPEHCPPGDFVREIPLPTRIPDDAKLEAYEDEPGNGLEIIVPKHHAVPEEHEVQVCLRSQGAKNELMLS